MSNKSIKQLIVRVETTGADSALKELKSLNTVLESAGAASKAFTKETLAASKYMGQAATAYYNVNKAIEESVTSVRKLNTALNGDTAKAQRGLNGYIDNLQILNEYLKEAAANAKTAGVSLNNVGTGNLDALSDLTLQLVNSMEHMNATLYDMSKAMDRVAKNTGKVKDNTKKTIKTIDDLEVTTNRGNETLEELQHNLNNTGQAHQKARTKAKNYDNTLKGLNGTGSQSARAFSKLAFDMNPLTAAYATIAINVYALSEAFRLLKEAAALDRLLNQTAQFSASISGINVKALAAQMQEISGGALSMGEAIKQAVRGVSFNFMAEDLVRLTEGARKASVAVGIDFTDAMDRVIRGISKGEVELLDELGVVTRLDTAYQKYAATLNKKADQLTDYQRKVALTTEVLSQLETKYKAFDTAANSTERLGVATKNLVDQLSMRTSSALDKVVGKLADFMEALAPQASASKKAAESLAIYNKALAAKNIDQAAVAWYEYTQWQAKATEETTAGTDAFNKMQAQMRATTEAVETTTIAVVALIAWIGRGALVTAMGAALTAVTALAHSLGAMTAVMLGGGKVLAALRSGFLAFSAIIAAATSPIWGTIAAVVAVGAAIAGLLAWLAPETFGAIVSAAGDAISWVVDQLKDLAMWIGEVTGITSLIEGMTGVSRATELAGDSLLRLSNIEAQRRKDSAGVAEGIKYEIPTGKDRAAETETPSNLFMMTTQQLDEQAAAVGRMNIAYMAGLQEGVSGVKSINTQLGFSKTQLQELAIKARELYSETDIELGKINPETIKKAEEYFNELKAAGIIAKDVQFDKGNGLRNFADQVGVAADSLAVLSRQRKVAEEQFATEIFGSTDENIKALEYQIQLDNEQLAILSKMGDKLSENQRFELSSAVAINKERIKQMMITKEVRAIENSTQLMTDEKINNLKLQGALESQILKTKITMLEAEAIAKGKLGQDVSDLEQKIALMKEEARYAGEMEAYSAERYAREKAIADQEAKTSQALNNVDRTSSLQEEIRLKQISLDTDKQMNDLDRQKMQGQLDREKLAADGASKGALFGDVSGAANGIAGLDGLTDLQSTFASSVSSMSDTYSTFLTDMEGSGKSFTEYLAGNIEAMSSMMQASVGLANQLFQTMSAEKIAGIDREIEAEKRRDGKSAESLAKIKALEAKKIKEEAKAKKASIIMSTAAGMMQAYAQMGPFGAPFAAAIAVMGAMQLGSIDKAANGQLAALNDGGGSSLSISGGNRSNEIDVSKRANSGELAYIQGMSGTGTANNFTPGKAVGGLAGAGTSIVVGESGPETITPAMPVHVSPAGAGGSQPTIVFSPVLNATAVDTEGMEGLFDRYSRHLFDSLEKELNARNRTLESL